MPSLKTPGLGYGGSGDGAAITAQTTTSTNPYFGLKNAAGALRGFVFWNSGDDSLYVNQSGGTSDGLRIFGSTITAFGALTAQAGVTIAGGGLSVAGGMGVSGVSTFSNTTGSVALRPGLAYNGAALDVTPVTLANLATIIISPNNNICVAFISANSDGTSAMAGLRGGANTVDLFASAGSWGTTGGGAHTYNVYYDGAGNYRLENRSGGPCSFNIMRIGAVPTM